MSRLCSLGWGGSRERGERERRGEGGEGGDGGKLVEIIHFTFLDVIKH
jgi:hypothetical protein